jgi:diaminopimelate epimerase
MSAAGNDFIIIDNRREILHKNLSGLAKNLCRRKFSIGADGLILLEKDKNTPFRMQYFNSDGSRAAMCGNGARCTAQFAYLERIAPKKMVFETDAGLIHANIISGSVQVEMTDPVNTRVDYTIDVDKRKISISSINTGVPHVVIFVPDIEKCDILRLGRTIRYHHEFSPDGTNVNFVQEKGNSNTIAVRTYERGVEDETFSCGTGITASAVIAGLKGLVTSPVKCVTRSGIILKVSYRANETKDLTSPISNIYLEGPAEVSFRGEVEI